MGVKSGNRKAKFVKKGEKLNSEIVFRNSL